MDQISKIFASSQTSGGEGENKTNKNILLFYFHLLYLAKDDLYSSGSERHAAVLLLALGATVKTKVFI